MLPHELLHTTPSMVLLSGYKGKMAVYISDADYA